MFMAKKLTAEFFGIETEDLLDTRKENIEEIIFEFGRVNYRLGRLETDGKETEKEYNQLTKRKEKLGNIIAEFLKSNNL